jgi:hypothetical protein
MQAVLERLQPKVTSPPRAQLLGSLQVQVNRQSFAEIFWTVIQRFMVLSATMWNITSSDGIEQQKLAPNVFFQRRNAPTSARANDVEIEDRLAARSPKYRLRFLRAHPRSLKLVQEPRRRF